MAPFITGLMDQYHSGPLGLIVLSLGISRKNLWEKMRRHGIGETG